MKIDSIITSVVVYPDRARLLRRGEVALKEGVHQVEMSDLSVYLDPDSLRATARGTARALIKGVQASRQFMQETPSESVRDLESQYETTQDEIERVDAQVGLVDDQKKKLRDLAGHTAIYARSLARGEISVDNQLALFDSLRSRGERLEAEGQSLVSHRRELDRKLQKIKKELDQLQSARPRERYSATIEIQVVQPGTLVIDLAYMVSRAGWKPIYDLRLIEENAAFRMEAGFLAQITQRSGENWSGVELTLSTARPSLSGVLPELEQLDIVFVDLEMPSIDGYEVLDMLRHDYGVDVPIVASTVHLNEIATAREMGFHSFLGKPLKANRFPDQLARILRGEPVWEAD